MKLKNKKDDFYALIDRKPDLKFSNQKPIFDDISEYKLAIKRNRKF